MELSLEELNRAKDALGEEDRLALEHEIGRLTGRRYIDGKIGKSRFPKQGMVLREFGEKAALELFSKLGRFFIENGYYGSGSGA